MREAFSESECVKIQLFLSGRSWNNSESRVSLFPNIIFSNIIDYFSDITNTNIFLILSIILSTFQFFPDIIDFFLYYQFVLIFLLRNQSYS